MSGLSRASVYKASGDECACHEIFNRKPCRSKSCKCSRRAQQVPPRTLGTCWVQASASPGSPTSVGASPIKSLCPKRKKAIVPPRCSTQSDQHAVYMPVCTSGHVSAQFKKTEELGSPSPRWAIAVANAMLEHQVLSNQERPRMSKQVFSDG